MIGSARLVRSCAVCWLVLASCQASQIELQSGEASPATAASAAPAREPAGLEELHVARTPGGEVSAHFWGTRVGAEPGSPVPPLSYGVERLEFTFAGDAQPYPFRPTGELFFNDWSFHVFAPDGRHVALLQDHYGPYHIVASQRLKGYLLRRERPDHEVSYAYDAHSPALRDAGFTKIALVIGGLRWLSSTEVEFEARGQTTIVLRHVLGGETRVVAERPPD